MERSRARARARRRGDGQWRRWMLRWSGGERAARGRIGGDRGDIIDGGNDDATGGAGWLHVVWP
jgi:hypothetical protein